MVSRTTSSSMSSGLVADWTQSVQQANVERVEALLSAHPDLYSTALQPWDPELDAAHVINQLHIVQSLGTSLQGLNALQYTLLQHLESPADALTEAQLQTAELVDILLEHTTEQHINTLTWGDGNTTLHLVSFLNHVQVARRLLHKNARVDLVNAHNCSALDVAQTEDMLLLLDSKSSLPQPSQPKQPSTSNDRFQRLKELAESKKAEQKQLHLTRNAEGRYFRAGHVAESKRKVLNEEEAELEKQRARRRQEVQLLAQRSAVKSNPLLKRFETTTKTEERPVRSQSPTASEDTPTEKEVRRNSKVIAALRNKSYVSSSVFRQAEPQPGPRSRRPATTSAEEQEEVVASGDVEEPSSPPLSETTPLQEAQPPLSPSLPVQPTTEITQQRPLEPEIADGMDHRRLSGSQKNQWSIGMNSWASLMERERLETLASDDDRSVSDSEEWFDSQEDALNEAVHRARKQDEEDIMQQRQKDSIVSMPAAPVDDQGKTTGSRVEETMPEEEEHEKDSEEGHEEGREEKEENVQEARRGEQKMETATGHVKIIRDTSRDTMTPQMPAPLDRPPPIPKRSSSRVIATALLKEQQRQQRAEAPPLPEELFSSFDISLSEDNSETSSSIFDSSREGSFEKNSSIDISPPLTAKDDNLKRYGSVSVKSTSSYARRLPASPTSELLPPIKTSSSFRIKRVPVPAPIAPSSRSMSHPTLLEKKPQQPTLPKRTPQERASRFGKLYFRVHAVQNVLLPLPAETTQVRCVVSDTRYEYLSRYERLGQHITFDYECILDVTDPNVIITVSLHVRPDQHVRANTISRIFTSSKQRKGSFSSYISQEDGAIGRARFALSHMLESCHEKSYQATFDCFNAWSTRKEMLKVVGSLGVEMLFLPLSDLRAPVPRNLRDCDMALKIQQWNETLYEPDNRPMHLL